MSGGRVTSVNVSDVRTVEYRGTSITTGIFKKPVAERLAVAGINVRGDAQADRSVHGGPTRAVYAYAEEDYAWWSDALGRALPVGTFGENLTLAGIDVTRALVGERWRVGTTTFDVTSPRVPCFKLAMVMDDPTFVKRFAKALRPGAYLAIVEPGEIGAGDVAEIVARPEHTLTLEKMTDIYFNHRDRSRELLVPELPESWREWVVAQTSA